RSNAPRSNAPTLHALTLYASPPASPPLPIHSSTASTPPPNIALPHPRNPPLHTLWLIARRSTPTLAELRTASANSPGKAPSSFCRFVELPTDDRQSRSAFPQDPG